MPASRRKLRKEKNDAFVFPIKLAVIAVGNDPDRPDGFSMIVKRDKEQFDGGRLFWNRGKITNGKRISWGAF